MAKITTANGTVMNIVKTECINKSLRLSLTRKTCRDGQNRYAVILRNRHTHRNTRIKSYPTISEAYKLYKAMATTI